MSKILDGIVKMVADRIVPYHTECNQIYFTSYVSSIQDKRDKFLSYIDRNYDKIHRDFVSDAVNVASRHISIKTQYSETDIENYILYLLVSHLNDQYYNHRYQQQDSTLYIQSKDSPDTYRGVVKTRDDTFCVRLKPKNTELAYPTQIASTLSQIIDKGHPMPFCIQTDLFVGVEVCSELTREDPYLEVIKDVTNQLKCLKAYQFNNLVISDIGRSSHGTRRYFIHNFDSVATAEGKHRAQLLSLLSVLCTFFTYDCTPKGRFREYVDYINGCSDDDSIYEEFILYLLHIK